MTGPTSTPPPDPGTAAHRLAGDRPGARRRLPDRVVPCWRWALVAALVPPVGLSIAVAVLVPDDLAWIAAVGWSLAGLLVALGAVAVIVLPPLRHAIFWYALSDDELDVGHGVVFRRRTVVPMARVQNLRTARGPLARWYRLTTVRVGTAAGAVVINGLELDEADRICALISRLADVHDDL